MTEAYDGRQVVGMDLHRHRSVLVRTTFSSPRSAALSALQARVQSLSASIAAASTPTSTLHARE